MNSYRTSVDPTTKNEPGAWLLDDKVTVPELSVAVASGKRTVVPGVPRGTDSEISSGQVATGGTLSTDTNKSKKKSWKNNEY